MLTRFWDTKLRVPIGSVAGAFLVLGIIFLTPKQSPVLTKELSWSNPNHSIFNPTFSHSGRELAFVQQLHIPDGHEAEEREGVAQNRLAKLANDRRLADPVISLLTLSSKQVVRIDYGWEPSFSLDDKLLAYAFQQIPISGKRVLAATLAGNSIKLYDRATKQQETIATPSKGFLLEPVFINKSELYYKVGAATNGAFGGAVGLRRYNLLNKHDSTVYAPRKSFGNAHLIGEVYPLSREVPYLVRVPQDKGFGYMANEYAVIVRTTHKQLYSFGKTGLKNLDGRVAITGNNDIIYLDDQHELRSQKDYFVRYHGANTVFKKLLSVEYKNAYLSPDGSRALICPYESEPFLLDITTFKRTTLALPATEVYSAAWSSTSSKLAVVQDDGTQDTDVISVFSIR